MNPAAAEEMQDLIRSLSTEELKALRTELAGAPGASHEGSCAISCNPGHYRDCTYVHG